MSSVAKVRIGTPKDVQDRIDQQVARGARLGDTIEQIAARMDIGYDKIRKIAKRLGVHVYTRSEKEEMGL